MNQKRTTFDRRRPLTEDDLWQKTTFDGRRPLTEDDIWQKTTFDRGWPFTEDNIRWKTTFNGGRPLTEDSLWRKMTFDRRQPLTEDNFWRQTTFDGGWPSIGCIVYYLKIEKIWDNVPIGGGRGKKNRNVPNSKMSQRSEGGGVNPNWDIVPNFLDFLFWWLP